MGEWYRYERTSPRNVEGGIKTRSARGAIGQSWWAQRWNQALQRIMDPGRLSRGKSYARKGQVISIEEKNRKITAQVQGSRKKPYKVRIELEPLSDESWDKVLDVLANQALYTARLLAGEMPADIEQAFTAAGASLFPTSGQQLDTNCSCPDWANPCKHIAAVYFLLGEAFDDDPFMLFRLRGRTQEQVLRGLRARRAAEEAEPEPDATAFPEIETGDVPLPLDPAAFWNAGEALFGLETSLRPPEVQLAVLQRVGQPSFIKQDILKTLGPVYKTVSLEVEALILSESKLD
ncbi:MAG: SWIM zinc finger family protein [Anaerolineales bacterium]|nr:SWIM zinc finger family protein [Anaerolineales bacterium]